MNLVDQFLLRLLLVFLQLAILLHARIGKSDDTDSRKDPARLVTSGATANPFSEKESAMFKVRENFRGVKPGDVFGNRAAIGVPFEMRIPRGKYPNGQVRVFSVVQCQCGQVDIMPVSKLVGKRQHVACSGCIVKHRTRYEIRNKRLYFIWADMKRRCSQSSHAAFRNYGGRGICVCDEWTRSYPAFAEWSLSNGYADDLQIDRRNNNGNYEPDNCRWVTNFEQQRNRRNNAILTAFGESKCVSDWADDPRCTVTYACLLQRICRGVDPELAITCRGRLKRV